MPILPSNWLLYRVPDVILTIESYCHRLPLVTERPRPIKMAIFETFVFHFRFLKMHVHPQQQLSRSKHGLPVIPPTVIDQVKKSDDVIDVVKK